MESLQCISCNSPIIDASKSCKCGHVNEAMRTIAGKRFSGYREELYTRRVIKESRDEFLRLKRGTLGIKERRQPRHKTEATNKIDTKSRKRRKLRLRGLRTLTPQNSSFTNGHFDDDLQNTKQSHKPSTIKTENHVTNDVTVNRKNNHNLSRSKEGRTMMKPLEEFSMAGPLAEINKRLMNQSTFWMCLANSLSSLETDIPSSNAVCDNTTIFTY